MLLRSENAAPLPEQSLRTNGATAMTAFFYATLPQTLPQMMSYTLYRWENNIRAAAILGVVGAGGLGDLAIRFGYQRFQTDVMVVTVVVLLILVQVLQMIGDAVVRRVSHR